MEKFIKVSKREGKPHDDIPLNDDGALALSILHKYFPRAVGLKYYSDADNSHEIDIIDEKFYPPLGLWGDITYYCILSDKANDANSDSLCIEDIPMYVEENEKSGSLNMVHISIKQTTATKTKKKTARPKGKYKKRRPFKCDICEKRFRSQDYMQRHKLVHTGEKPFSCSICDEKFIRPDLLRIHVNKVHSIRRKPKHILRPRSPTSRKRDKRKTDDLYEWGEVKKRKYNRRKPKIGHEFSDESSNEEEQEEGKFYECHSCSVQFSSKSSLTQHSCISGLQTQFTCEECHQTFSKLSKLRLHLYKCHADQKPRNAAVKTETLKLALPKSKSKCKYVVSDMKREPSDIESSDEDVTFWEYQNENEHASYISKCNCVPDFNIVKYIELKIPPEILNKFKYCKENGIPWTGFLGYSALYKFWARIVNENPIDAMYESSTEVVHIVDDEDENNYTESVADYLIKEEEEEEEVEPSEATTENSNFLKGLDDLIKFN